MLFAGERAWEAQPRAWSRLPLRRWRVTRQKPSERHECHLRSKSSGIWKYLQIWSSPRGSGSTGKAYKLQHRGDQKIPAVNCQVELDPSTPELLDSWRRKPWVMFMEMLVTEIWLQFGTDTECKSCCEQIVLCFLSLLCKNGFQSFLAHSDSFTHSILLHPECQCKGEITLLLFGYIHTATCPTAHHEVQVDK